MNEQAHQPIAGAARAITKAMAQISNLRHDVPNNRGRLVELVNTVNALLIPRGWVGIDADGMLHVTYVAREDDRPSGFTSAEVVGRPASVAHQADFVWEYSATTRTVRCTKCRDGSFAHGEVRTCDGPVKGPPALG